MKLKQARGTFCSVGGGSRADGWSERRRFDDLEMSKGGIEIVGWNALNDDDVLKRETDRYKEAGEGDSRHRAPLAEECIFAFLSLVLASLAMEAIKLQ